MNDEHVLKGAFEGIKFGPGKYGEFSAAPTVDPTMAHVHLNKRIIIGELVHRRTFVDLAN